MLAYRVLDVAWHDVPISDKPSGKPVSAADIDGMLRLMEANFARNGHSVDLSGLSMAQVMTPHDEVFQDA